MALWQEALETGQKVHPLTEETLNKHMQGPIIIEDERNAEQVCCFPLYCLSTSAFQGPFPLPSADASSSTTVFQLLSAGGLFTAAAAAVARLL